jgi:reverse gyrase
VLILSHKKDSKVRNKMYRLASISKESPNKKEEFLKKMIDGKIVFLGQGKGSLEASYLHEHY